MSISPEEIGRWITSNFEHVRPKETWGETSFFVNPDGRLPSGAYFATIKETDGENDKASNLDRDGVFRFNFVPGKKAFVETFGTPPARPPKGGIIEGPWDFTEKNLLMPHPIYGWMGWMCILNPTKETFSSIEPLLYLAYDKARETVVKRLAKQK